MARGKPVALETIEFDNQSLALDFFRSMLNRYIPGERVEQNDAMHLAELFKRHPDYTSKIGNGVDHYEVMPGDYGTQCFCAVRTDGSKEGFSYKRCVTQKND